jgi:Zn-dependent protease with chaperone function
MKSFDESNAYEQTRREEALPMRNAAIIGSWIGEQIVDRTIEVVELLKPGERLTTDELREIREDVERMAAKQRDQIIREWEINEAAEGAE